MQLAEGAEGGAAASVPQAEWCARARGLLGAYRATVLEQVRGCTASQLHSKGLERRLAACQARPPARAIVSPAPFPRHPCPV